MYTPLMVVTNIVIFCMQTKLELLSSRMQESQILRANIASLPLETRTSNALVDAVGDRSWSLNLKKEHEVLS